MEIVNKEAEIRALQSQMNPHFIFNAMSVIQSYIYDEDTANSSKFLIHFSKLMRMILENNAKQFIPLETELEIINRYLVLQKMRFEDRFGSAPATAHGCACTAASARRPRGRPARRLGATR